MGVVETALLQLGAGLERLDAPVDAVRVGVCAVEQGRYGGCQFGSERGFRRLEGCLGD